MKALIGKAIEEDNDFWDTGLFIESEDDEDFQSNDQSLSCGKDSFDSDFNDSSSDVLECKRAVKRKNKEKKKIGDKDRKAVRKDQKVNKSIKIKRKSNSKIKKKSEKS